MGLVAPYSVGTFLPSLQLQKCNIYSPPLTLSSHRHVTCSVQLQPQPTITTDETLLNRRTVIGFLAFDALFAYSSSIPAPAAETPCEFKVAPSGLAFCDKFLGTGPEPAKGQLIKVFSIYIIKILTLQKLV